MSCKHTPPGQRGFSLIELLVAVAVLAFLTAAAVPAFTEYFERSRLRGAADEMVSFFNTHRINASKFDRDINVTLRGTGTNWCIGARAAANPATAGLAVPAATSCNCSTDAAQCLVEGNQAVLSSATLAASGQRPSIDGADISIVFDGRRGTLADFATAGDVVLTSSGGRYQLRVDILGLGQARVCLPAGARAINGYQSC